MLGQTNQQTNKEYSTKKYLLEKFQIYINVRFSAAKIVASRVDKIN